MRNHTEVDDKRIELFLAPLEKLHPASMSEGFRSRRRRNRGRVLLAGVAVAVIGAGGAVAATQFGPLHNTELRPSSTPLNCAGIIGKPAAKADSYLRSRGYVVSWRLERFGSKVVLPSRPNEPTGVEGGYAIAVKKPPAGTILLDVARIGPAQSRRVIATATDPHDPNAPTVRPPPACSESGS